MFILREVLLGSLLEVYYIDSCPANYLNSMTIIFLKVWICIWHIMNHPFGNLKGIYFNIIKDPEVWKINIILYWVEHPLNARHRMFKYSKSSYCMPFYLVAPMYSFHKFISLYILDFPFPSSMGQAWVYY